MTLPAILTCITLALCALALGAVIVISVIDAIDAKRHEATRARWAKEKAELRAYAQSLHD